MSDIFISYAHEDRPQAEILAQALEALGWSVWWDRTIPAGRVFDEVIEEALDAAKCVIVLWSGHSVKSDWVKTEAQEGADRKILIPVLIEAVRIPLSFRRIQSADLIGWKGEDTTAVFIDLIDDIASLLGSPAKPESKAGPFQAQVKSQAIKEETKQPAQSMPKPEIKKGQLWNKMIQIISDQLGADKSEVTKEASFIDNLGADSLDLVELVMAFEEEYNVEIEDQETENLLTVGDAYQYGIKKLGL
jgi:acyl carrier protein